MRTRKAPLAVGLLVLASCQSVAPQPTAVVVPLRSTNGLTGTCTGEPLPIPDECRSQGEQAFVELQLGGDAIADIAVDFGSIAVDGCRTVTWHVRYSSGARAQQPTEVCGIRSTWTKGRIPDAAWRPDGSVDASLLPDFIPVADGDGIGGWIASSRQFPADADVPRRDVIAVLADDLLTVVGGMYPGAGFVPLGAEAEVLSNPENRRLTLTVRNESSAEAVLDITEARDEGPGPHDRIAPSITVAPNSEREVLIEVPRDRWSLNLRGDLGFFYSDDLGPASAEPDFALVVTPEGVLTLSKGG